jgi:hypothetical protein
VRSDELKQDPGDVVGRPGGQLVRGPVDDVETPVAHPRRDRRKSGDGRGGVLVATDREDGWGRAKAFDTSLPLGPCIETDLARAEVDIIVRVSAEEVQRSNTRDMIQGVASAMAMASEGEIGGIGTFRNPVARA